MGRRACGPYDRRIGAPPRTAVGSARVQSTRRWKSGMNSGSSLTLIDRVIVGEAMPTVTAGPHRAGSCAAKAGTGSLTTQPAPSRIMSAITRARDTRSSVTEVPQPRDVFRCEGGVTPCRFRRPTSDNLGEEPSTAAGRAPRIRSPGLSCRGGREREAQESEDARVEESLADNTIGLPPPRRECHEVHVHDLP